MMGLVPLRADTRELEDVIKLESGSPLEPEHPTPLTSQCGPPPMAASAAVNGSPDQTLPEIVPD